MASVSRYRKSLKNATIIDHTDVKIDDIYDCLTFLDLGIVTK